MILVWSSFSRILHSTNFFQQISKELFEIEKKIVRKVVRGDKHYRRKSGDRTEQIALVSGKNSCTVACASRAEDFLR